MAPALLAGGKGVDRDAALSGYARSAGRKGEGEEIKRIWYNKPANPAR